MAVTQSSFGMGHLTVVPTNFEPGDGDSASDESGDDETAIADDE